MKYAFAIVAVLLVSACGAPIDVAAKTALVRGEVETALTVDGFKSAALRHHLSCEQEACGSSCRAEFQSRAQGLRDLVPDSYVLCRWYQEPAGEALTFGAIEARAYANADKLIYTSVEDIYTGP